MAGKENATQQAPRATLAERQVDAAVAGEPLFVLLGRDALAPKLIREWCRGRAHEIRVGIAPTSDAALIDEAREMAAMMEWWRDENKERLPAPVAGP